MINSFDSHGRSTHSRHIFFFWYTLWFCDSFIMRNPIKNGFLFKKLANITSFTWQEFHRETKNLSLSLPTEDSDKNILSGGSNENWVLSSKFVWHEGTRGLITGGGHSGPRTTSLQTSRRRMTHTDCSTPDSSSPDNSLPGSFLTQTAIQNNSPRTTPYLPCLSLTDDSLPKNSPSDIGFKTTLHQTTPHRTIPHWKTQQWVELHQELPSD